jgi:uncharacterized protein YceH (UPF0502 family)
LNALVSACNQSSNREPVLSLDETTVHKGIDDLTRRSLVRAVHRNDSRARRYRQTMSETMNLHPAETAIMGVLMLRGPQTVGEIRTRTARMFEFVDLSHVEITLQTLMTLATPLVVQLPRQPGQKEVRYAHLLSGQPDVEAFELAAATVTHAKADRIEALEQTVEELRAEMKEMRAQFEEFRREFQ